MEKNSTLLELIVGSIFWGILCQVVCLLFFKSYLYNAVGLWVGVALAIGLVIHMNRSIEDGLELGGEDGVKHMQKGTMTRLVIAFVVMGAVMYLKWGNPLSLLAGVMALKVAAYLQPIVHRILGRKKGGEK